MNRIFSITITIVVIVTAAYTFLDILFSNTPDAETYSKSNSYIDATGREVSLSEFSGSYLWVDYAAEWCGYCDTQARTLKAMDQQYGDRLTFLTVVTGTDKVMVPPTAETAMNWANRYHLDPNKVFAYFSTNTLPYHILYSPSGEILFQGSGLYQAGQITSLLKTHALLLN